MTTIETICETINSARALAIKSGQPKLALELIHCQQSIRRLESWIKEEGIRANVCTYDVLGAICENCECGFERPKTMNTYKDRVIEEKKQLDERGDKLEQFILSDKFSTLPAAEQERMKRQLEVMGEYSEILAERIAGFSR